MSPARRIAVVSTVSGIAISVLLAALPFELFGPWQAWVRAVLASASLVVLGVLLLNRQRWLADDLRTFLIVLLCLGSIGFATWLKGTLDPSAPPPTALEILREGVTLERRYTFNKNQLGPLTIGRYEIRLTEWGLVRNPPQATFEWGLKGTDIWIGLDLRLERDCWAEFVLDDGEIRFLVVDTKLPEDVTVWVGLVEGDPKLQEEDSVATDVAKGCGLDEMHKLRSLLHRPGPLTPEDWPW